MTKGSNFLRKTPSQVRSQETFNRVLYAATRIFHEQGYDRTTTNDIADEADLSIGSVYQYFANKDSILIALTLQHIEESSKALACELEENSSVLDTPGLVSHVTQFLVEQHELDSLHVLLVHHAPRTLEINKALNDARNRLISAIDNVLIPTIESQHRRNLTASLLYSTVDAAVHNVLIRQSDEQHKKEAMELLTATVLSIIELA